METVEYRELAAQFPDRVCRLVVTWRWPLLLSLLLHTLVLWPAFPSMEPAVSVSKPALRGHLQAQPSPDLPEVTAPGVAVAGRASVTKTSVARPPTSPPIDSRDDAVSAQSASMQVTNVAADAAGLRVYRAALARALSSGAWRKGLNPQVRGALEVGIVVDASGQVQEIGLVRGSGEAELDRRLLEAVRMAVREVAIPSRLQTQPFFVALPIEVGEPEATSVADR